MSTSNATPDTGNAPRLRLVLHRQAEFESHADSDSDSQPERETYPTFSELRSRSIKPYPTLAAVRIVWSFDVLPSASFGLLMVVP
ncbi:hypothetical protein V501_01774 [Pseudogymnoascus sp. VKM F-4519 (FW-2642)]|nr:hypothetical protein V501_01774 [Pseudogymnoascus sp. VKM F-4519 (FW-2642)]